MESGGTLTPISCPRASAVEAAARRPQTSTERNAIRITGRFRCRWRIRLARHPPWSALPGQPPRGTGLRARGQNPPGIRPALHPCWIASLLRCFLGEWLRHAPRKRLASPALRPSLCSPGRVCGPLRRALPARRLAALGARAALSTGLSVHFSFRILEQSPGPPDWTRVPSAPPPPNYPPWARNRSASSAAMHPVPAAETAWR